MSLAVAAGGCGGDERPGGSRLAPSADSRIDPAEAAEIAAAQDAVASNDHDPSSARGAIADARALGKPLFVFVAPVSRENQLYFGLVDGVLLQSRRVLEALSLSHVVCLSEAEIEAIAPGATNSDSGTPPLAVVLETVGGDGLSGRVVVPTLTPPQDPGEVWFIDALQDRVEFEEPTWQPRAPDAAAKREDDPAVLALLDAPRLALLPDETSLPRRARLARAAIGPEAADELERAVRDGIGLAAETADRRAAIVFATAARLPGRTSLARDRLLAGARARLVVAAPPGGEWRWGPPSEVLAEPLPPSLAIQTETGLQPHWCGTGWMESDFRRLEGGSPAHPRFLLLPR